MSYHATLVYSKPLLRQAVFSFWRRSVGLGFVIALLLGALILAFLVSQGDKSWFVGALGAVLAFGVILAGAIYIAHYSNALRKLNEMGSPQATLAAEDSVFTLTSEVSTSSFRWSVVKEVWQFPNYWLLLFSKAQFVTLPTSCLSPEMQEFILRQVHLAGGKVS